MVPQVSKDGHYGRTQLVGMADAALYRAKSAGRNGCQMAELVAPEGEAEDAAPVPANAAAATA